MQKPYSMTGAFDSLKGKPSISESARQRIRAITDGMREAYKEAAEAQSAFWDALSGLEEITDIPDIDGNRDFTMGCSLEILIEEANKADENQEPPDDMVAASDPTESTSYRESLIDAGRGHLLR